jgi:hypothetical protein
MPPETEPAVDGAGPGCYDKASVPVLLEYSGAGRASRFAKRIGREPGDGDLLGRVWQYLSQERIGGIARADPRDKRPGDQHGKDLGGGASPRGRPRWKVHEPAQRGRVAD